MMASTISNTKTIKKINNPSIPIYSQKNSKLHYPIYL